MFDKKSILQIVPILLLAIALPLGLNLLSKETVFKSRASNDPIVFKVDGENVVERNGQKVAIGPAPSPKVTVLLTSPIGPAAIAPSASPTTSPTGSPVGSAPPTSDTGDNIVWNRLSQFFAGRGGISVVNAQSTPTPPTIASCTVSKVTAAVGESITYTMYGDPGGYSGQIDYNWEKVDTIPPGPDFVQRTANDEPTISGSYTSEGLGKMRAVFRYANQAVRKDCTVVNVIAAPVTSTAPAPTCSAFTIDGIGAATGTIYTEYTVPSTGHAGAQIKANSQASGFTATIASTTPTSAPAATIQTDTAVPPNQYLVIPANTSSTINSYVLSGTVGSNSCKQIKVNVSAGGTAGPTSCTSLELEGAGTITSTDPVTGGKTYTVSSDTPGLFPIKINGSLNTGFTAVAVETTAGVDAGSGVSTGRQIARVPQNTSTTEQKTYNFNAGLGASTSGCPPLKVIVDKRSTNVCDYQDTVIKFRKQGSANWEQNGEIAKGERIDIAAFHKPKGTGAVFSSTAAPDVRFTYVGPNGDGALTAVGGIVAFSPTETISSPTTFTINAITENQGATGCNASKSIVVKPATFVTEFYKIAESPDKLASAPQVVYTGEPMTADIYFSDTTPGRKFVFVQFIGKGSDGSEKKDEKTAFIDYVGPDPRIDGVSCKPAINGVGMTVQVTGKNLGVSSERSTVMVGGAASELTGEWSSTSVSSKTDKAVPDTAKQSYPVILTRADGIQARSVCKLGLSQLTVEPKLSCATAVGNLLNGKSGDVTIVDSSGGIAKEKVTIDSDGTISGLKFRLVNGQRYRIYIKAGNALKRSQEFTASEGTTVLSGFELPFGDLNNDGKINTADYRMLLSAWSASGQSASKTTTFTAPAQPAVGSTTLFTPTSSTSPRPSTSPSPSSTARTGVLAVTSDASTNYDLNGDGAINSFDLKCMIAAFNQSDDTENNKPPTPEVVPVASPSPTPTTSVAPVTSTSPSPTSSSTSSPAATSSTAP